MIEAFSEEGQEIVVKGYKFEPVFNVNAIQTVGSSLEEDTIESALRNRVMNKVMKVHRFHFGLTLSGKQSQSPLSTF